MKRLAAVFLLFPITLLANDIRVDLKVIDAAVVEHEVELSTELDPYKDELHSLPYNSFEIKNIQQFSLPLDEVQEIDLPDSEVLKVRVFYSNHEKSCLWLQWLDFDKRELLNTRIHLRSDKPVIVGSEVADGVGGRILTIKLAQ